MNEKWEKNKWPFNILSYPAYAKWKLAIFAPIQDKAHSYLGERKKESRRVGCCFSHFGPIDCELLSQRKETDPDLDISIQDEYGRVLLRAPEEDMERKQSWAKKEENNAVSTKTSANPMRNSVTGMALHG